MNVNVSKLEAIDLKKLVNTTTKKVFDTMLSMELKYFKSDFDIKDFPPKTDGMRLVGSISLVGLVVVNVSIHVNALFGRIITAAMQDVEPISITDGDVSDAVAELTNMIGGNLKSFFCDTGLDCKSSVPSVTSGHDFKITNKGWNKREILAFRYQLHNILVDVRIKKRNNIISGGNSSMKEIKKINMEEFITKTTCDVFKMMLSMDLRAFEPYPCRIDKEQRIVGAVCFAGAIVGCINIQVSHEFSRIMTVAMLGMDEIEDEAVDDVVGELSNMIGGSLKSKFCDTGMPCELSIPTVTSGKDFKIESMGWTRHECYAFQNSDGHLTYVEIFIKPGN